eukprot:1399211-Amphidinium_carterae.1
MDSLHQRKLGTQGFCVCGSRKAHVVNIIPLLEPLAKDVRQVWHKNDLKSLKVTIFRSRCCFPRISNEVRRLKKRVHGLGSLDFTVSDFM